MGAWQRLVNWDGSDEYLKLLSEALVEVQTEQSRRNAQVIRSAADDGDLNAPEYGSYENVLEAADLIDPEMNR